MKNVRSWVQDKWYDYVEEIMAWEKRIPDLNAQQYFRKYRWMLKTLYKHELKHKATK
jgi:hypothetical protein